MECKSLRESATQLDQFQVAYFGASCDPLEKNKQFAEKLELNYPLLSDTDGTVAKAYGIARGNRSRRVTIFVNVDGTVAHIEENVDLRNHGQQIVDKLKELNVPKKEEGESGS